jgi:hypothetical protein
MVTNNVFKKPEIGFSVSFINSIFISRGNKKVFEKWA